MTWFDQLLCKVFGHRWTWDEHVELKVCTTCSRVEEDEL